MTLIQYIKDTQGELRHVAWPTRMQTVVYTILVASISLGVALYLGLFDYIFTSSITRFVGATPSENTSGIQLSTEGTSNGSSINIQPVPIGTSPLEVPLE